MEKLSVAERTYFIGGPGRIGKTTLAYRLADAIRGHVTSTDAIVSALRASTSDMRGDLFAMRETDHLPEEDWIDFFTKSTDEAIARQHTESRAAWPAILAFCQLFNEDNAKHIVEGVAITPDLVAAMEVPPAHVIFIGNTNPNHAAAIEGYAASHKEDWIAQFNFSSHKIGALAVYIAEMSADFAERAALHGYRYYDLSEGTYEERQIDIVADLCQQSTFN